MVAPANHQYRPAAARESSGKAIRLAHRHAGRRIPEGGGHHVRRGVLAEHAEGHLQHEQEQEEQRPGGVVWRHRTVEEFHAEYCWTLDCGDVESWPQYFTEDAVYRITARENADGCEANPNDFSHSGTTSHHAAPLDPRMMRQSALTAAAMLRLPRMLSSPST